MCLSGTGLVTMVSSKVSCRPDLRSVNSPSCLSSPAACRSLLSMCSKEHLRLCTKAAKFIISVVSTLPLLPTCQTAHGHRGSVRHQTATTKYTSSVISLQTNVGVTLPSSGHLHNLHCELSHFVMSELHRVFVSSTATCFV